MIEKLIKNLNLNKNYKFTIYNFKIHCKKIINLIK